MTDKQIIREALSVARKCLFENDARLEAIPDDCGTFSNYIEMIPASFQTWRYFGKCNDIYVVDEVFGDATTMQNFVDSCSIINGHIAIRNIYIKNGDRRLPKSFERLYGNIVITDEADDFSRIVFGINEYQRIAFVYLVEQDIHYFFDCDEM